MGWLCAYINIFHLCHFKGFYAFDRGSDSGGVSGESLPMYHTSVREYMSQFMGLMVVYFILFYVNMLL